jgi:hypothetical protein
VLEFLTRAIMQEKNIKGILIENEWFKLSPFTDNMTLYIKTPAKST